MLLAFLFFSKYFFFKDSAFLCPKKVLKGLCVKYPHFSRDNPNVCPVLKSLTNCRQISDFFSLRKALGNKTIPYWGVVVTGEAEGEQKGGKTTTASFSCGGLDQNMRGPLEKEKCPNPLDGFSTPSLWRREGLLGVL